MSLKLGTQDIAGISQNTKYNAHHLLDFKWTDCIMNDVSWLRADTFSWQSGDVYTSAYNHLVADLQGATSETETIGSYTITFYRATDGHKITTDESTVANIYNETGIAWYYILDTTNTRFKLPRTKYGFEGIRNNVGDNIEAGLPNITGQIGVETTPGNDTGAFYRGSFSQLGWQSSSSTVGTNFDASRSNSIYGNSTTVQPPATQMYLYFYVGDYSQTAVEQTAGINAETLNGKADVDLSNTSNKLSDVFIGKLNPDYSAGITCTTSLGTERTYTAPANGIIIFNLSTYNKGSDYIKINDVEVLRSKANDAPDFNSLTGSLPVTKNDVIKYYSHYSYATYNSQNIVFYPLKGVN